MTETFAALHRHMEKEGASPSLYVSGRKSKYTIPDFMDKGVATLMKDGGRRQVEAELDVGVEGIDVVPELEDVSVDLLL